MTRLRWVVERVRAASPAARTGVAGIVAILLLAAGLAVAARNHPRAPDSAAKVDRIGDRLDAVNPWEPRDRAADGGKVRVLEQGFARIPDPEIKGKVGYTVSVLVENTSRTDAVIPRADFDVRDADGQQVDVNHANDGVTDQVVPPGVRVGITGTMYLDKPVADEVSVNISGSEWYGTRGDVGEVTAADVRARHGHALRVRLESSYDTTLLAPTFHALYRDKTGKLIGGEELFIVDSATPVPPGASEHDFPSVSWPKNTDLDAIEVYVLYDWTVFGF